MNERNDLAELAVNPEHDALSEAAREAAAENAIEQPDIGELEAAEYWKEHEKQFAIQQNRARQLFSTRTLLKREWEQESFLIGTKLLPKHGRMLISGTTGTGKSTLTLNLAASLATGSPMFRIVNLRHDANYGEARFPITETSIVLYVDYEVPHNIRTRDRLRPLIEHFPETLVGNLFFAQHPTRYRLQNEIGEAQGKGSWDALKQLVEDVRPDVLILDPLSSTHSLQENGNEIKQAYNKADKLIDEYGCAVIIVLHASPKFLRAKDGQKVQKDTIEQIRGHSSQGDWADCHMHFTALDLDRDDQDEKLIEMSFGKHRHCRKPEKRTLLVNFRTMEVRPANV